MPRHGWSAVLALTALLIGSCGQPDEKGRVPATPLRLPGEPDTAAPYEPVVDTPAGSATGVAAELASLARLVIDVRH